MTQDEIIEMANQSQLFLSIWIDDEGDEIASLVAFAKLVEDFATAKEREGLVRIIEANIADEREACAKVCDDQANSAYWEGADACAYRIRARGEA